MKAEDGEAISEITIAPDGRIFVFGTSRQVLEVLDDLNLGDLDLKQRLEHLRGLEADGSDTTPRQQDRVRCAVEDEFRREGAQYE